MASLGARHARRLRQYRERRGGRPGAARRGPGVVGLDPSPVSVERARGIAPGVGNLSYMVGGGTALPFEDGAFDAVVFHTVLSHIPEVGAALAEAARVTAAGGALAAFDGDHATTTVAIGEHDPLQACVDAPMDAPGEEAADALKGEARRRVAAGEFFGHIAYASLIGRRA
ncbi:MAG: class I SAM-dependent methyltransferase [Solirubrobacteraceae bacterium]